ncbi:uncharacterized protein LOC131624092 [Vicia villosa]|uniref:uncharacterized protein LOC131624092 n=1 Tax=Vicia villosa TaxID=3911 RepID=UPI00273B3C83|nr:uncharacterized protein LOC131624092 [Vicia villosa]
MEFHKWWVDYCNQQIFDVAGLSHELNEAGAFPERQNIKDPAANTSKSVIPSKDKKTNEDSSKTSKSKLVRKAASKNITVESDGEDCSPPHIKLITKKRQKASIPLVREKESGTSKPTASSGKNSSDEQLPKTVGANHVVESHNSSPDNIPSKKPPSVTAPILSDNDSDDILKNTQNIDHVEDNRSNDSSPDISPANQDVDMEEHPQLSNIDEGDEQSAEGTKTDPMDEDKTQDEASSQLKIRKEKTKPFGTVTVHTTISTKTPPLSSQAELESLKATDPAGVLKTMMSARSSSSSKGGVGCLRHIYIVI